jgi:hypothetical protein
MARLENALEKYEVDFADSRLFLARILNRIFEAIIFLIAGAVSIGLAFVFVMLNDLRCELQNDCVYGNLMQRMWYSSWVHWEITAVDISIVLILLAIGSAYRFFLAVQIIGLETSPDKYRARLRKSLDRVTA